MPSAAVDGGEPIAVSPGAAGVAVVAAAAATLAMPRSGRGGVHERGHPCSRPAYCKQSGLHVERTVRKILRLSMVRLSIRALWESLLYRSIRGVVFWLGVR